LAHLGRPKGAHVPDLSLAILRAPLAECLGTDVTFAAQLEPSAIVDGGVTLMENVRFEPGEEANDPAFAARLAALGAVYVNDAFSCAHRAHASTQGITAHLPSFAGLQMLAELDALSTALENPVRPVAAVVGGAKVSTKIPVLENLVGKVDVLIIGGGMANTFLAQRGYEVGTSLHEADQLETVERVLTAAQAAGCKILLPSDFIAADAFSADADQVTVPADQCPADRMILDVGPATVGELRDAISTCRTILWNGPMGAFEMAPFANGTVMLAKAVAALTRDGKLTSVAGGGDTVAALNAAGVAGDFSYVSTAGGAFLEWLEGRTLPGVAALQTG
ncbi:MAG: phosphoglycerate kinase, partial [Pseudomonadota bacterium]